MRSMQRNKKCLKTTLLVLGLVTTLFTILLYRSTGTPRFDTKFSSLLAPHVTPVSADKANLNKICSSLGYPKAQNYLNAYSQIYTVDRYNLEICIVPKAGCSFLKQVIYFLNDPRALVPSQLKLQKGTFQMYWQYLNNITKIRENIFALPRQDVHFKVNFNPISLSVDDFSRQSSHFKVIVTRNPYTRLYSAFIDKIYVPALFKQMNRYLNSTRSNYDTDQSESHETLCSLKNESFEGFLEKIILLIKQHRISNQHWLPVTDHCNPCEAQPDLIIHQESYSDDVKTLLETVNVTSEEYSTIREVLAQDVVQSNKTLQGLIITMFEKGMKGGESCFTEVELARRVWDALKYQGQIHTFLKFPERQLKAMNEITPETVTNVFLNNMKEKPISVQQSKFQRRTSLIQAYRRVPAKVLQDIQSVFHYDFLLFGYDKMPPT